MTNYIVLLYLDGDDLIPCDTLLQQLPVGVHHIDDHSHNVTDEHNHHQEPARHGLT